MYSMENICLIYMPNIMKALYTYNVAIKSGHFHAIHNDATCIVITLVKKYIMMLYHAGDVIYDINKSTIWDSQSSSVVS
jgi:hypothetical protein